MKTNSFTKLLAITFACLFTFGNLFAQIEEDPGPNGTGVVTVTANGGSCLGFTAAVSNGPDNWEVAQGGSYTMTITGVTECTGDAITVFVQSSNTGNFCFNALAIADGVYQGDFTVPDPACFTMPISYKCGGDQPCDNSATFNANGPSNNHKVHLRASIFDGSCTKIGDDEDCSSTQECPPISCSVSGEEHVNCGGNNHTYSVSVNGCTGNSTINWSVTGDASINGDSHGSSVDIVASNVCGGSYTVSADVTCSCATGNDQTSSCSMSADITCVCEPPSEFTVDSISPAAALICWNDVPCNHGYRLGWAKQGSNKWQYREIAEGEHCTTFTNNYPTVYQIKVLTYCGDGNTSDYSTVYIYHTFPSCLPPTNLYTDPIHSTDATGNWTPAADASKQNFWFRKAGTTSFTRKNVSATATSYQMKNLLPNTGYEWQVRSSCSDATRTVTGAFSSLQSFTTSAVRMGLDESSSPSLYVYPNPTADGSFVIDLNLSSSVSNATIVITNVVGQVIYQQQVPVNNGELIQQVKFAEGTSFGTYLIKVVASESTFTSQLIYQY